MFNDVKYMRFALELAQKAAVAGEVPIGAIIVSPEGNVLGAGYNLVEQESSSIEHAEMCAIRDAQTNLQDWRLDGCTMYVTLEPCLMCLGGILLARIERLVYASASPIYGYTNMLEGEDLLYGGFLKNVTPGILADEASILLDNFFLVRR